MTVVRYQSPPSLMQDLRLDLARIMDPMLSRQRNESELGLGHWRPHVDVKETADGYVVYADLPGITAKDIKISFNNQVLTLQGTRKLERKEDDYQRVERYEGSFVRQFSLPHNIDASKIQAKFKEGVLEVQIPKLEAATTQYIEIETES